MAGFYYAACIRCQEVSEKEKNKHRRIKGRNKRVLVVVQKNTLGKGCHAVATPAVATGRRTAVVAHVQEGRHASLGILQHNAVVVFDRHVRIHRSLGFNMGLALRSTAPSVNREIWVRVLGLLHGREFALL